ncbi:MAG: glycogen synthase GlgA [Paracoccaceae bacterium]
MNVLFVASECAPFIKTGGLADVIGSVPKALAELGVSVKVLLPAYPALDDIKKSGKTVLKIADLNGGPARVIAVQAEGLDLLLLEAAHLFDRPGNIYLDENGRDWSDNYLRFGGLSKVGAEITVKGVKGWHPDVVNAHDWQGGLVAAYLEQIDADTPPCVLTIHNIAFQGLFDPELLKELGLKDELFVPDGLEYFGQIGFLKAGIAYSKKITTVSPTYANELLLPEFGMGLDGLMKARDANLTGILNGIDLEVWNPATDADLVATYSVQKLAAKKKNRTLVETRFGLNSNPDAPLFCVVSRLTSQKGLDLLLDALPGLVGRGARLAVLGSGDIKLEAAFIGAAHQYEGSVGVIIGYDEALSHLMQGGSDAILIPSRFEPCGLTQLYGLRYGTLPVVARTGGLQDTVIDANDAALVTGCATGFQFSPITVEALESAIGRACDLFSQPKTWSAMMRRAMRHPVGWDRSALAYFELYRGLSKSSGI